MFHHLFDRVVKVLTPLARKTPKAPAISFHTIVSLCVGLGIAWEMPSGIHHFVEAFVAVIVAGAGPFSYALVVPLGFCLLHHISELLRKLSTACAFLASIFAGMANLLAWLADQTFWP